MCPSIANREEVYQGQTAVEAQFRDLAGPHTLVMTRIELTAVFIGVTLLVVGVASPVAVTLRPRSGSTTLVTFGLWCALYGLRLLASQPVVRGAVGGSPKQWAGLITSLHTPSTYQSPFCGQPYGRRRCGRQLPRARRLVGMAATGTADSWPATQRIIRTSGPVRGHQSTPPSRWVGHRRSSHRRAPAAAGANSAGREVNVNEMRDSGVLPADEAMARHFMSSRRRSHSRPGGVCRWTRTLA